MRVARSNASRAATWGVETRGRHGTTRRGRQKRFKKRSLCNAKMLIHVNVTCYMLQVIARDVQWCAKMTNARLHKGIFVARARASLDAIAYDEGGGVERVAKDGTPVIEKHRGHSSQVVVQYGPLC